MCIRDRDGNLHIASGSVTATSFTFPTGESLSPDAPVIVWHSATTTPNIFFPSGNIETRVGRSTTMIISTHNNVGIGVLTPNSLLEVGRLPIDKNPLGHHPEIAFEFPGLNNDSTSLSDRHVLSIDPDTASFYISNRQAPQLKPFNVHENRVGVHIAQPTAALHVSGNTILTNIQSLNGTNELSDTSYDLNVAKTNIYQMYIKDNFYSKSGLPWSLDPGLSLIHISEPTRPY